MIRPYSLSVHTRITIAVPILNAVSISCEFMRNPASPVTVSATRSGKAIFAAIAPGTPIPIDAKPLEMMQVLGCCAWYIRAIHILWAPTSLITMSRSESVFLRSQMIRCGFIGKPGSSAHSASSSRITWRRAPAANCSCRLASAEISGSAVPMSPITPAATM